MRDDTARLGVDQEGSTARTTDVGESPACRDLLRAFAADGLTDSPSALQQEVARLNRLLALNSLDGMLLSWVGTNDSRVVAVLREMYPPERGVGAVGSADPERPACSLRTAIQRAAASTANRGPKL